MLTSQLIAKLQESLTAFGDLVVVSGVTRTGYGEPVQSALVTTNTKRIDDNVPMTVLDLILSDSSYVERQAAAPTFLLTACDKVPSAQGFPTFGFPTFHVKGTYKGEFFESKISLELHGRNAAIEHISGYNLSTSNDDFQAELYDAIYATPAYQEAAATYK